MARKNFKATQGLTVDSYAVPAQTLQATVKTNSATTIDTVALTDFNSVEYTLTIKQGSKIRTSKVIVQTDGTSVDLTEFGITETGGAISGVVVSATTLSTNMILQVTVTDAATTIARVIASKKANLAFVPMTPDAPTNIVATGGQGNASVAFDAPYDNGGGTITEYIATSNTGNFVGTASSSPVSVTVTTPANYSFTVQAKNSAGISVASSSSNTVTVTQPVPTVSGGTLSQYNGYYYRTFTSSGNFVVNGGSLDVEALVIAGGAGAGGAGTGCGGGAGGLRVQSISLSPNTYPVTIGSGGARSWILESGFLGNFPGNNSVFSTITSLGGANMDGGTGGSGSGRFGSFVSYGTSGQGYDGGSGHSTASGGGGGAGGVGGNARGFRQGGHGGTGLQLLDWSTATNTGYDGGYYAGGGGAGGTGWGTGGLGGGGTGQDDGSTQTQNIPEMFGKVNSGGGGGGRKGNEGAPGGSGIVIIRYTTAAVGG